MTVDEDYVRCRARSLGSDTLRIGEVTTLLPDPPQSVSNLQLSPASGAPHSRLTANWDAALNADEYAVYVSDSNVKPQAASAATTETEATLVGLQEATTYHVWVEGSNLGGA